MITIILLTILGGCFLSKMFVSYERTFMDYVLGTFIGCFIGILLSLLIGACIPQKTVEIRRDKLVTLKDNITTEGSFFLGSGTINGEHKYFYYKENGQGGFLAESVNSKGVPIYEDSDTEPYISILANEFINRKFDVLFIPNTDICYAFHIPKNSIIRDYKLDLK